MLSSLFNKSYRPLSDVVNKITYMRIVPSQKVENGVIVNTSTFEEFNIAADLSKFSSADFSLGNILSIGAFDTLKPVVMHRMSDMSVADKFENYQISLPNAE